MHLTEDQLARYLAGALDEAGVGRLEAHIDQCEACRVALSARVRDDALAKTVSSGKQGGELPVQPGALVLDRYEVVRLLGAGGMGCVFEARHLQLNQRFALKFMLPELARDQAAVDRFVREARAAVRLRTEHVGRVLDLGALPGGLPVLIMEYLEGETLEATLAREGRLAPAAAVDALRQVLEALEEAHGLGIVHRDLKPGNLFLATRPNGTPLIKVLDFGLAKSVHPDVEAGLARTSRPVLLGSPLYMAPEQLKPGTPIDARADLWALGCTFYQLLTGATPFVGGDLVELMYAIAHRPHAPLRQHDPALARYQGVVDACLQKDPSRRVSSVAALRALLDQAERAPTAALTARPTPRRLVVAATLLVGLAAGVTAWLATRALWRPDPTPVVDVAPPTRPPLTDAPPPVAPTPPTVAVPAVTPQPPPEPPPAPVVKPVAHPAPGRAKPSRPPPQAPPAQPVQPPQPSEPRPDPLDHRL